MKIRIRSFVLCALLLLPTLSVAAPSTKGTTGLFELVTAETLPRGKFNVALYADKFDRAVYAPSRVPLPGTPIGQIDFAPDLGIDTYIYSLAVGYGITDWFEVGLQVPYEFNFASRAFQGNQIAPYEYADLIANEYSESGIGDPIVSLKFRIANSERRGIAFAAILEGKAPTADEETGLGTGEFDGGLRLAFSKSWSRVGFHINAGYYYVGKIERTAPTGETEDILSDEIFGAIGMDFCPFRNPNFKLILEVEGGVGGYDESETARYITDRLNAVLGFRYFFQPRRYSYQERQSSYAFSIGAGVRYAILEGGIESSPNPSVTNDEASDDQNPWGFVAHVAFSPRVRADNCRYVPKPREKEPIPPSVTVTADPSSWTINEDQINDDLTIEPNVDPDGNTQLIMSRIRAVSRDPDGPEENITYSWTYQIGDLNETYLVTDVDGNPVTTSEFDFEFTAYEDADGNITVPTYTFFVTVTDEQGLTDEGEISVDFTVVPPVDIFLAINNLQFNLDMPQQGDSIFDSLVNAQAQLDRLNQQLDALAQQWTEVTGDETPEIPMRLGGHACQIERVQYNLDLSERRAIMIEEYLRANGYDRIYILERVPYGEEQPIVECPRSDTECTNLRLATDPELVRSLAPNRRVEFDVLVEPPADLNLSEENVDAQ